MPRTHLAAFSIVATKNKIASIILVGNAFVWYFVALSLLASAEPTVFMWIVHFLALILSAFVGASFAKQIERQKLLIFWILSGIVASIMLLGINGSSEILSSLIAAVLGVSLGFGMPICMGYFRDNVPIESRGRVSGITMLASGIGMVAFRCLDGINLLLIVFILCIWRMSSLLIFFKTMDGRETASTEKVPSYRQVFGKQSFILYFVPWVIFSLVNYFAGPLPHNLGADGEMVSILIEVVRQVSMGVAAVIGGVFADLVGRRRIAIGGFAMLGLGTAVLGFLGNSGLALYFGALMEGVAWGFLSVLFLLTVWGDLSQYYSSEKYYVLGVTPFFVSKLLELTVKPIIYAEIISFTTLTTLFSFTSFFLFLAVLPLFYAPETLPEKNIKDRELQNYIEKAKKEATKAQMKEEENTERENEDTEIEFKVNQEDYERALMEAEKYS